MTMALAGLGIADPPARAAGAGRRAVVSIPTGGGSAPSVTVTTPVVSQSAGAILAAARRAGSTAAGVQVSRRRDSQAMPPSFIGLSLEYQSIQPYAAAEPLFDQMLANLTPGQQPLIRIGGDSADHSGVPIPGYSNPGVWDIWGPSWMAAARQIAQSTGAELIPDLDLEVDDPQEDAAEVQQMEAGIGSQYLPAFELGNEPDVYDELPWYDFNNDPTYGRPAGWDPAQYITQLQATLPEIPNLNFWGPALGANSGWWSSLPQIAAAIPNLRTITYHAYGTSCYAPAGSDRTPSVGHLLAPSASVGLAQAVAPEVAFARQTHRSVRVDEVNTVTCAGRLTIPGFASTLWAIEVGFALDQVGVSGLNVHMFPTAAYRLFSFSPDNTSVSAADEYYGWLAFARAAPPGSRQLTTTTIGDRSLRAFTSFTGTADNVVLLNDSPTRPTTVTLSDPGRTQAVVEDLRSPNMAATSGLSLAGMSISPTTGRLAGTPRASALGGAGSYSITLPPASVDLVHLTG